MVESTFPVWILIPVVMIVFVILIWKFKGKAGLKDFIPKPFSKTVLEHHKTDVDDNGIKVKGRLCVGFNEIGKIGKYLEKQGAFTTMVYDTVTRKAKILTDKDAPPEGFDVIIFKVHPRNGFKKVLNYFLGKWWRYYVVEKKAVSHYDSDGQIYQLDPTWTLYHYGGCWISGKRTMELQDSISILASKESMMTHAENMADRIIHLEAQTARKNQIMMAETKANKARWESSKRMDDTEVTTV